MARRWWIGVGALALAVAGTACTEDRDRAGTGWGGGGGNAVPPPVQAFPTTVPAVPTSAAPTLGPTPFPLGSMEPTRSSPSNLAFVRAQLLRGGDPVDLLELGPFGWTTVDLRGGTATWFGRGVGTEHVRWRVPPQTLDFSGPTSEELWIEADCTSLEGGSLNHQPYLQVVGTAQDASVQVTAYSENGVQADSQVGKLPFTMLTSNARIGADAHVYVHLGWQATGFLIDYEYEYR